MVPERIVDISITEMNRRFRPKEPTLEEILADCCLVFNQSIAIVRSKVRKQELVNVRRITSYVALRLTTNTLQKIANTVGSDSHTTILSHIKKVKACFHIKDSIFLENWDLYVTTSKIWNKYKYDKMD